MTDTNPIRVMIVDDHAVVRSGLTAFIQVCDDLEMVAAARNGQEALSLCDTYKPDVILMDLVMPVMDGPTAIRRIVSDFPHTAVVALTSFHDGDLVQTALQAGATSYLLKDIAAAELAEAIRAAHAGKSTLAHEAAQVLISATTHPPQLGFDLTPRELEVLNHLALGETNLKIAKELTISRSTVKYHVSSILSKLDASSRTEAVSLALRHNLVRQPG